MGGVYGSTKNAATRVSRFAAEVPQRIARELAPMLDNRVRDQFANETDPYGKPLAPLKASTIRRKRGNAVILYRTGRLGAGSHVRFAGRRLVFTYGPASQYAQDGEPGEREPRHVAPAYGIPASWKADAAAAAARVAKRGVQ